MRTLVYKRTHEGDPDGFGRFGASDCMKRVRGYAYEAVIGIGAITAKAKAAGIDGKVNWIGIGPHKTPIHGLIGPLVTFDHFRRFTNDNAPDVRGVAPMLAERFYREWPARWLLNGASDGEQVEIDRLLKLAKKSPPSIGPARLTGKRTRCPPKRRKPKC
jgi:hypothetical protein